MKDKILLNTLFVIALLSIVISFVVTYFFQRVVNDNSLFIIPVVTACIATPLLLMGIFGLNIHNLDQKMLRFAEKKGIGIKGLLMEEANIKKALVYEKARLYAAAIYLPTILIGLIMVASYFTPEMSVKSFPLMMVGICLLIFGLIFTALFYNFEYRSYKTVYPQLKFWQYFLVRVGLNY